MALSVEIYPRISGERCEENVSGCRIVAVCTQDPEHWWDYETVTWRITKHNGRKVATVGHLECTHGKTTVSVSQVRPTWDDLTWFESDGVSPTTCEEACEVEPDGSCEHGHRAWTWLAVGFA
jgi:hypothetical protein